ncbi:MAG: hypothetical protein IPL34_16830 [Thiofilum sp.]|nr:hypothetical protein [Thiofilum sp.]
MDAKAAALSESQSIEGDHGTIISDVGEINVTNTNISKDDFCTTILNRTKSQALSESDESIIHGCLQSFNGFEEAVKKYLVKEEDDKRNSIERASKSGDIEEILRVLNSSESGKEPEQLFKEKAENIKKWVNSANHYLLKAQTLNLYYTLGKNRLDKVREAYERALVSAQQTDGDVILAEVLYQYAWFLQKNALSFTNAKKFYLEALEHYKTLEKELSQSHVDYTFSKAKILRQLGVLYYKKRYVDQSEDYFKEALSLFKLQTPTDEHRAEMAATLNDYGVLVSLYKHRKKEAFDLFEQAYRIHVDLIKRDENQYAPLLIDDLLSLHHETLNLNHYDITPSKELLRESEKYIATAEIILNKILKQHKDKENIRSKMAAIYAAKSKNADYDISRKEEASHLINESMNIYRELVNENPLAYLERLVVALIISTNNIGSEQTNEKNIPIMDEVISIIRPLYQAEPEFYEDILARTLLLRELITSNKVNNYDLKYLSEAIEIQKNLFKRSPNTSLSSLLDVLSTKALLFSVYKAEDQLTINKLMVEIDQTYKDASKLINDLSTNHSNAYINNKIIALSHFADFYLTYDKKDKLIDIVNQMLEVMQDINIYELKQSHANILHKTCQVAFIYDLEKNYEKSGYYYNIGLKWIDSIVLDKNIETITLLHIMSCFYYLSNSYITQSNYIEAEKAIEKADNYSVMLIKGSNTNRGVLTIDKMDLFRVTILGNLGKVKIVNNKYEEAFIAYKKYFDLLHKNPNLYNARLQIIAYEIERLTGAARFLSESDKTRQEAEAYYTEVIIQARHLAKKDPKQEVLLGSILNQYGYITAKYFPDQRSKITNTLEESIQILSKAAKEQIIHQAKLADATGTLGYAHLQWKEYSEAKLKLQEALNLLEPFYQKEPANYEKFYQELNQLIKQADDNIKKD